MSTTGPHELAAHLPADEIRRFHEVLARGGYNEEGLVGTLGPIQLPTLLRRDRAHFQHLTRRGRPLDLQIRLFLLGIPLTLEEARAALEPVGLEEWARAGLVGVQGGEVRGLVRIMAFRKLLLASDQLEAPGTIGRPDLVMGITSSTSTLADSAIPRPSRSTLDLGTGSGVQAFVAAAWSERVWAVDRSARSINFARFNAALNGVAAPIEFLEGDGFEPVRGRTFDRILSNPPFAVSPSFRYLYRDSGMEGDAFARGVIENAARCLNEGGYCQIVCDWAHVAGEDWKERLRAWFDGSGCDAWVMRTDTQEAAAYAHVWIRDTEHVGEEETDRLYAEWLAYYARQRIEAISTGLIAIRKAGEKPNWVRIEDGPGSTSGEFGEYVARGFELGDFLQRVASDEALLEVRLKVEPSARLDHVCEWEDASWRIRSAKIRLAGGLQYEANVDLRLAGMVALCDGLRTMREVLAHTAQALGADLDRITPNCLALTRQLIERGFLLPVAG
ncbi:MAG: methyltransferase [Bryobacteraceae bacterium]|jgi:2-polyprenyl-3-methyl-5-hydroxy-6-metoxy-1,4-benzoquinol methylase